jgi:DNA (cytosine-5)-methyltransferase 1
MMNSADSEIRTKGSLCTGTGALDAALPGTLQWMAEADSSAAALLARTHEGIPNLGDITKLDWSEDHHVDLLTSGDPCQSMSAAGRQMASGDPRFLWPFVIDTIRRTRPKEVFLENVQNLVSVALVKGAEGPDGERGSVLRMRLEDLRAAGYAVRWTVLGACAVGAPHHRHRWFLRGRYVGQNAPEAVKVESKCGAPRTGGRALLPSPTTADGSGGPGRSIHRLGGDNLRTAVTLLPTPVTRDFKGADMPQRDGGGQAGTAVALLPTSRATDVGTEGRRASAGWRPQLGQAVHTLLPTPRATDGVNGGPNQRGRKGDLAMGSACQPEVWGKFADAVALWESIIGRPAPEPTVEAPRGGRRLNPALSEWMMGYPEGVLTEGVHRNEALKRAGNGVVALQARAAWDLLA